MSFDSWKRALVLWVAFFSPVVFADFYLSVKGGNVARAKIAVGKVNPLPGAFTSPAIARKMHEQVLADLELINLFEILPENVAAPHDKPNEFHNVHFPEWSTMGASFFLRLGYRFEGQKLILEALLYDIPGQKKVLGMRYGYPSTDLAKLVHAMSEDILKELTGERGLFFSRIAMACWDPRKYSPAKEIYMCESDGRSCKAITFDKTLALSPAWSPDGKFLAYNQHEWVYGRGTKKRTIVLKTHNLLTGERKVLSRRDGMNGGGSWSPKGNQIAATMSYTGQPELYFLDPTGESEPEPLSRGAKIKKVGKEGFDIDPPSLIFDVEANWSPDAQKIVFSKKRGLHPMIYILDIASRIATQLTFAGTYNASPAWSPKGDKIIFAAQRLEQGNFDLFLIDPDGNNLKQVTNGDRPGRKANSENPTWAPTGRHLAFSSDETGRNAVYVMSLDGAVRRKISPDGKECKTPAWGPRE